MQAKTFLPDTLQGWLVIIGLLLTWAGTVWTIWTRQTARINGLGGRVKRIEEECKERDGRVSRLEDELTEYRRDREITSKEMGELKASLNATNEHMTEMKLELAGHMGEIKSLIVEKDASTRERLARIETTIERNRP